MRIGIVIPAVINIQRSSFSKDITYSEVVRHGYPHGRQAVIWSKIPVPGRVYRLAIGLAWNEVMHWGQVKDHGGRSG